MVGNELQQPGARIRMALSVGGIFALLAATPCLCFKSGLGVRQTLTISLRQSPHLIASIIGVEEDAPSLTKPFVSLPMLPVDAPYVALIPTSELVPSVATLLFECFYSPGAPAGILSERQEAPNFLPAGPATSAPDDAEMPAFVREAPVALQDRWRMAAKGLRWRLGSRLEQPTLEASLETSLMVVLRGRRDGELVACAELSLRPIDGKLPGEFAVPPLFLLHSDTSLGAYLSNLAVHPTQRRRGVATQLLDACEELVRTGWQRTALYLHVDEHNTAAAHLYRSRGYECLPAFDNACQPICVVGGGALPSPTGPRQSVDAVRNRFHRKWL